MEEGLEPQEMDHLTSVLQEHDHNITTGTYGHHNIYNMQQHSSKDNLDYSSTATQDLRFEFPLENEPTSRHRHIKKPQPYVYRDQDRFVPINNIGRTMRNSIPKNGKVSKDAKECMQECVSEFISFLTSEASDRCIDEKRKTITGDDILFALSNLGFDNYVEPLQLYLKKYREYTRFDKGMDKSDDTNAVLTPPH